MMDLYLQGDLDNPLTPSEMQAKLDITHSHCYKLNNTLLTKCYQALAPSGGLQLLTFLNRKYLYKHFKAEMARQEEELLKRRGPKDFPAFYQACFELLQRTGYENFDFELFEEWGQKYLDVLPEVQPVHRLYVQAVLFRSRVKLFAAKGDAQLCRQLMKEVLPLQMINVQELPSYEFCLLHNVLCHYYMYVVKDYEMARECILAALDYHNSNENLPQAGWIELRLLLALNYYFSGQYRKGFTLYDQLYSKYTDSFLDYYYHQSKLQQLAIILGKWAYAKRLLRQRFPMLVKGADSTTSVMACTQVAKFHLHQDELEVAKEYLDKGFANNQRLLNFKQELELRCLDTVYFVLVNDLEVARQQLRKHQKYLRLHDDQLLSDQYQEFFYLLDLLLRAYSRKKTLAESKEKLFNSFFQGNLVQYGMLLEKVRQHLEGLMDDDEREGPALRVEESFTHYPSKS